MSEKKIIPKELFLHKENVKTITEMIEHTLKRYGNIKKIMRTFCIKWFMQNGLLKEDFTSSKNNVTKFVQENNEIYKSLLNVELPSNELDILGIIYQILQTEGTKNEKGSYYTPKCIVDNMIKNVKKEENIAILDPCCGTGMFLNGVEIENPANLYGIDIDEIAVMICKTNLMVKYKEKDFIPNIYQYDFFDNKVNKVLNLQFDYIITNPPWGAAIENINQNEFLEILSGESFSYFLAKSKTLLKENGTLLYLLPESFLNVKVHADIRKYLIENMTLKKVTLYPNNFSGVLTKFVSIEVENVKKEDYEFTITNLKEDYIETKLKIMENTNYVIRPSKERDKVILDKIFSINYTTLTKSEWGLGIVTGNNKEKLKKIYFENAEPIYTGKEISAYTLLPCKNYIAYKREEFQQVAPDRIYRAPEKLVYKFISKDIVFAYDNKKSLFLNSANILIPNIEGMSIKTTMAFLNSNLFKYIYRKKFGEIKILKGNLVQLPFPIINEAENISIENLVDDIMQGKNVNDEINHEIYRIFSLTSDEIEYIEGELSWKN